MSAPQPHSHRPGFEHPVRDAQHVFRAVLEALARPTSEQPIGLALQPPPPLRPTVGAIILALCDEQTPVWLDAQLGTADAVGAWIGFHTGARIVERPADALFAIASSPAAAPRLADLAQGTDEEPHRSATLVVDGTGARGVGALAATGPGIRGSAAWDGAGLPDGFLPQWQQNRALFPRGVDLVIAAESSVRGLPRTTALVGAELHSSEQGSA